MTVLGIAAVAALLAGALAGAHELAFALQTVFDRWHAVR